MTTLDRLLGSIEVGFCWQWTRPLDPNGYGKLSVAGKSMYVHRLIWQELVGPIPPGDFIDHMCFNRCCINPEHLRTLTPSASGRVKMRADYPPTPTAVPGPHYQTLKTHCPQGHEYSGENLFYTRGRRACRACYRGAARQYRRRVKG